MPSLYIITGSNGAGKSTIGHEYLPEHIRNNCKVFDGDLVFVKKQRELFPLVTRSPKEAKKLAFEYVKHTFEQLTADALNNKKSFVYEGHFTNDATWDTPRRFKKAGYDITLLFFGLTDPNLSQLRVAARVTKGGHFVDRLTIEDNFRGNLEKLNLNFRLIDHLTIVGTSKITHIIDWFITYLPAITALII